MVKVRGASTVSLHFEKHKNGTSGLQRHVERVKGQKHSNQNINDERTADNIFLIQKTGSYEERIKKIIESEYTGKRAVRKDAVKMVEATVQLGGDIIQNGTEEEQIEALKDAFEELKERYGEQNIVAAVIHVDETTPHLHFDFVPIQNGKLTAKKVLGDKVQMKRTQTEFLEAMNERTGLRFERKEDNSLNGLTQKQYKVVKQRLEEVDEREERLIEERVDFEELQNDFAKKSSIREKGHQRIEKELAAREVTVSEKEEKLGASEVILKDRVKYLNEKIKKFNQAQEKLKTREENVSKREKLADLRDSELKDKELTLERLKTQNLADFSRLNKKQEELLAQEEKLAKKAKFLEIWEDKLKDWQDGVKNIVDKALERLPNRRPSMAVRRFLVDQEEKFEATPQDLEPMSERLDEALRELDDFKNNELGL